MTKIFSVVVFVLLVVFIVYKQEKWDVAENVSPVAIENNVGAEQLGVPGNTDETWGKV